MPISISGSNLQQQNSPHIHRKHAGASKGVQEPSSAPSTVASDAGIANTTTGSSSVLTSFLAQLSSLDSQGDAPQPAGSPAAASSPVDQMMQALQVIVANKSQV